jgi:glucose/arabinose dehydrogenase
MAWLPDGSMLVTEKSGILYHLKNGSKPVKNVPEVYIRGQGGLLDIVLHPDYAKNGWIYITYASTEGGGEGNKTHKSPGKRKSRPNRITIQMRRKYNQGTAFWFPNCI